MYVLYECIALYECMYCMNVSTVWMYSTVGVYVLYECMHYVNVCIVGMYVLYECKHCINV